MPFFLMNRMKVRFFRFQMKDDHFFLGGKVDEFLKLKFWGGVDEIKPLEGLRVTEPINIKKYNTACPQ